MRLSWRDMLAALLLTFGGVVVFAKLQSYSWWLLGSWKGALGVVGVIGLAIMATYIIDWFENDGLGVVWEILLWITAATAVVGSLFATTNKTEFVWSAALIGLAWLSQLSAHTWDSTHDHTSRLVHAH